jgi:hypothetical protein
LLLIGFRRTHHVSQWKQDYITHHRDTHLLT